MSFILAASKSLITDMSNSSCTCMCGVIPSLYTYNIAFLVISDSDLFISLFKALYVNARRVGLLCQ